MTYDLVKQLKDGGFPQKFFRTENYYLDVAVPTLSELIEACGEGYFYLQREGGKWRAANHNALQLPGTGCDSPEEAVAKLWLALQQ